MNTNIEAKKTPLYDKHVEAGAKIAPYAGYLMPVEYNGIIKEHESVRSSAGIFDLTHMGELEIRGENAEAFVQYLITNDVSSIPVGGIIYTLLCNDKGGILDDALVYKMHDRYMLVVNAVNKDKIYNWALKYEIDFPGARLIDKSDKLAIIAVQGPNSEKILQNITPVNLQEIGYYRFVKGKILDTTGIISRTGYTGEDGFELYVDNKDAEPVWDALMIEGGPLGLTPIGLGARDTLRLEAKLPLYGNELNEDRNPFQVGLKWAVRLEKPNFSGRDALIKFADEKPAHKIVGFELEKPGIARTGAVVFNENQEEVGVVTSGTHSPTLKKAVGLAFVKGKGLKIGTSIFVAIRNKKVPARIIKTPFYKGSVKSHKKEADVVKS